MDTVVRIEIKDKRTLTRLLRSCFYVCGYVMFNEHEGQYIKLQKTDLMGILLANDYDLKKFTYDPHDNTIYMN